jgi:hypothetical protein
VSLAVIRASSSSYLTTGGAAQVVAFPLDGGGHGPQVGDPIGIWVTCNDSTETLPSAPTGWTLEYATTVGTGFRAFLHKVYASSDGASVTVTFGKQPNMAIATVVFDGTVHSGFGTLGTVTTRPAASTTSTAVATGSSAAPNLVVFHEKTTSQTSCTVAGATAIENRLPTSGFAGSVYIGTYDDSAGPVDITATYALTGNVNGCGYQIPLTPAAGSPVAATGTAAISLTASGTAAGAGQATGTATLSLTTGGTARAATTCTASLSLVAYGATPLQRWMQQPRWYVAHRGGSTDWVEESAYAYSQAAAWNRDLALEVSVWRSSDGVWVCSHDQTTGRLFGTNLDIPTSTWASLSALRTTIGNYPLARLTDILDAYATGNRVLFVDNKGQQVPSTFLDLLDTYGGKARFVSKGYCTATTMADAATARGYATWGYYYDADVPTNLPNTAGHWSLLGMDYTATAGDWSTILGYGKPVLGHIIPSAAAAAAAFGYGANGIVASGVVEAVPSDIPAGTATLTLTASGAAAARAIGTAGLSVLATGIAGARAIGSALLGLVASGNAERAHEAMITGVPTGPKQAHTATGPASSNKYKAGGAGVAGIASGPGQSRTITGPGD